MAAAQFITAHAAHTAQGSLMYTLVGHIADTAELARIAYALPRGGTEYELADGRFVPLEQLMRPLLPQFPDPWRFCFVVMLQPGGTIPPHCDKDEGTRYHIVLQTNQHAWNMNDDEWTRCELGGIYTMNPRLQHASINWGTTPRIHLVIDTETLQPADS